MMSLEQIVEMDDHQNKNLPWNKLNKSLKLKRIMDFANEYSKKEGLDDDNTNQLKGMLKDKLERKYLQKVKDVEYNCETEQIDNIPALIFIQNKYTLKVDTISPLISLAPKNKTVKKK